MPSAVPQPARERLGGRLGLFGGDGVHHLAGQVDAIMAPRDSPQVCLVAAVDAERQAKLARVDLEHGKDVFANANPQRAPALLKNRKGRRPSLGEPLDNRARFGNLSWIYLFVSLSSIPPIWSAPAFSVSDALPPVHDAADFAFI